MSARRLAGIGVPRAVPSGDKYKRGSKSAPADYSVSTVAMANFNDIWTRLNSHRLFTTVTYVLGVWSTFHYVVCEQGDHGLTHFTAAKGKVKDYWVLQTVLQFLYLLQFWSSDSSVRDTAQGVGHVFTAYQLLQTLWAFFFGKFDGRFHYIISWVIVVLNAANIMYYHHRKATYNIRPTSRWWFIHVPVMSMPGAWLLYAFFWNGALALHWDSDHKSIVGGILANVFIWVFLLDACYVLFMYRDWSTAFATAFWMCAISHTQHGHDGINYTLQHWFAGAISIVVAIYAFFVAYPDAPDKYITRSHSTTGEHAPLLSE